MKFLPRKTKGEFEVSFTKIFILLLFVVGGWAGFHYAVAYYETSIVQSLMTSELLANRDRFNSEVVADNLRKKIREAGNFQFKDEDLLVMLSTDGGQATSRLRYIYPVQVPIFQKTWNIEFAVEVDETLKR